MFVEVDVPWDWPVERHDIVRISPLRRGVCKSTRCAVVLLER
jgi:hypothetical protein